MLGRLMLPQDLQNLNTEDLESLCEEIRQQIVSVCLRNGGHLGASLGAVEIAVALHRIFPSPKNKMIWDVGHQAYAHKILTGRSGRMDSLRTFGGISGFLSRDESEHDAFGAGHSSTALSAALGFAYKNDDWTIAVVGDGGLTAGVSLEALNNIHSPNHTGPLLIVLNDNQMSISENVGGIHQILSMGQGADFFQMFGLEYVGPMNGHDLPTMLSTLNGIRTANLGRPVLLHLMTQKGKGYAPAESRPAFYHGVGPLQPTEVTGKAVPAEERSAGRKIVEKSWSEHFGAELIRLAENDPKIVAITAAMPEGTGLTAFAKKFPDRFFDVGIAEPHAVTFAAGLAANGWKPVCAIYSTFLQRAFDALIHDVALQKLPVVLAVDRAGLVGADGPTHHGVFDLAYANLIPGARVYTPELASDLGPSLAAALDGAGPAFVRFPRGKASSDSAADGITGERVHGLATVTEKTRTLAICFGTIGVRIRKLVESSAFKDSISVVRVVQAKPTAPEIETLLSVHGKNFERVVFFEEGVRSGSLSETLIARHPGLQTTVFAYPDAFVAHGTVPELEASFGWTNEAFLRALEGSGE